MTNLQELIQGAVAIALIGAYTALAALGRATDHLDLGIFAILGVYFSGKVSQIAAGGVRDAMASAVHRGPRSTDAQPNAAATAADTGSGQSQAA